MTAQERAFAVAAAIKEHLDLPEHHVPGLIAYLAGQFAEAEGAVKEWAAKLADAKAERLLQHVKSAESEMERDMTEGGYAVAKGLAEAIRAAP